MVLFIRLIGKGNVDPPVVVEIGHFHVRRFERGKFGPSLDCITAVISPVDVR